MAAANSDAEGWYHDRPARDTEEWKDWRHRICATKYDFTTPVRPRKRPIKKAKSKHAQVILSRLSNHLPVDDLPCKTRKCSKKKKVPPKMLQDKQKHDKQIQIFVKISLKTITETLKPSMSVLQVKELLCDKLGISVDKQELYTQSGFLKMCDMLTLSDHGIEDQSNIEVRVGPGLLGGADKPDETSEGKTKDEKCPSSSSDIPKSSQRPKYPPSSSAIPKSSQRPKCLPSFGAIHKSSQHPKCLPSSGAIPKSSQRPKCLPSSGAIPKSSQRPKCLPSSGAIPKSSQSKLPTGANAETRTQTASASGGERDQAARVKQEDIQNFVRCRKAIQEVCLELASSVDNKFKKWHGEVANRIGPCVTPDDCSEICGRPMGPISESARQRSCEACLEWADEIEYGKESKDITWRNLDSTKFQDNHVEVAKAFVYKAPKDKMDKVERFSHFDEGSLLLIMQSFLPFMDGPVTPRKASDTEISSQQRVEGVGKDGHKKQNVASHEGESSRSSSEEEESSSEESGNNSDDSSSWSDYEDESQSNHCREVEVEMLFEFPERELDREFPPALPKEAADSEENSINAEDARRQRHLEIIKKVLDIRCDLSHPPVEDNLQLGREKLQVYFADMCELVTLLEKLGHFAKDKADKLRLRLREIQTKPVTQTMIEEMKDEFPQEVYDYLQYLMQSVDSIKEENKAIKDEMKKVQKGLESFHINQQLQANHIDLTECQAQLKADYRTNRGQIGFLPGVPKEFPLEEFVVELTLIKEEKSPTQVKDKELVRYTDLLTLEDKKGCKLDHVLIRGEAGTGKTTTINQLAYQWATQPTELNKDAVHNVHNPLGRFELVFVLDIRRFKPEMDLVDCIQDQLLADLPDISKMALKSLLRANADKILYLFDGYDELRVPEHVLSNKLLYRSCVIITTRPNKVEDICQKYSGYVHVKIEGFSKSSVDKFISMYFQCEDKAKLSEEIYASHVEALIGFPLILVMICLVWEEREILPLRMTTLYNQVIEFFVKHWYARNKSQGSKQSYEEFKQTIKLENFLKNLGLTALEGLVNKNGKLIFDEAEFARSTVITSALDLGLLSKFYKRSGSEMISEYSFIHRTIQEFIAAIYWASLLESSRLKFEDYLRHIVKDNIYDHQYLLRFCCGLSSKAAAIILQHIVSNCVKLFWTLPITLLFEAEVGSQINQELHDTLRPLNKLNIFSSNMKSELWKILIYLLYQEKNEFRKNTWLTNIEHFSYHGCEIEDQRRCFQFLNKANESPVISRLLKSFSWTSCPTDDQVICNFVSQQLQLCHLELSDVDIYTKVLLNDFIPKTTRYMTYFDNCIPQLHTLCLVNANMVSEQWIRLFDVIVEAGKRLQMYSSSEAKTNGSAGKTQPLPMCKLDFSKNNLFSCEDNHRDVLIKKFVAALSYLSSLEHLVLVDTGLTKHSFQVLHIAFSKLTRIQVLNLGTKSWLGAACETNSLHQAGKELLQCLQNLGCLRELELKGTNMNDDDVSLLPLKHLGQLTKLDLSGNKFGSQGIIALSASLKYVQQLTHLDLLLCKTGESEAMLLSESLHHITLLKYFGISLADSRCVVAFTKGLRHVNQLENLAVFLSDYFLSADAAEALFRNLVYLPNLEFLYCNCKHFNKINHSKVVETCLQEIPELNMQKFVIDLRITHNIIKPVVNIVKRFINVK